MARIGWAALCVVAFVCLWSFRVLASDLVEPTPEEAEDIKRWIPATCCRTNNCCRKVRPEALIQHRDDDVEVAATRQILKRTGWSQDKNTWRCTCDYNNQTKEWDVHINANTRCVFPHAYGS